MAAPHKPNLILFLPDQQRADTLACYGGVKVRAPNLNKLASESVVFERTYVTHPVCTPSRSSLMTGTWPHINGCTRNSVPLDRRFRVFPELIQDQDYRTAYIGKWHLGEDGPAGRGFQHWVSTDDHGDYTNFLISKSITPDKSNGRFSEVAISNLPIQLFFGITPDEYRSIKQRYLGLVTLVDQSIGAILHFLERCGLTENTIVVHTSDHGDSLGAHHLFGKETMFEEAARVPWLIRLAGQTQQ